MTRNDDVELKFTNALLLPLFSVAAIIAAIAAVDGTAAVTNVVRAIFVVVVYRAINAPFYVIHVYFSR